MRRNSWRRMRKTPSVRLDKGRRSIPLRRIPSGMADEGSGKRSLENVIRSIYCFIYFVPLTHCFRWKCSPYPFTASVESRLSHSLLKLFPHESLKFTCVLCLPHTLHLSRKFFPTFPYILNSYPSD